jgi:hypothetical protein
MIPANAKVNLKSPPTKIPVDMNTPNKVSTSRDGEIPWLPVHAIHTYRAKRHDRYFIVIELPGSFTGDGDLFSACVENDGTEFVLQVNINEIFTDPFYIHAMLANEYGRIFGEDSAMKYNFEAATDHMKKKKATFRVALDFPCQKKVSDDLGYAGKLFKTIVKTNKKTKKDIDVPVLIIELKSVYQTEEDEEEDENLTNSTFKAPEKTPGRASNIGHIAAFLEFMFSKGLTLDEVKGELKRSGLADDADAMDIDDMYNKAKRSRGAVSSST